MVLSMCTDVLRVKPDLVITEKGVSDLAQHYLVKAGVSVIRRVRKSDNNRIARYVLSTNRYFLQTVAGTPESIAFAEFFLI